MEHIKRIMDLFHGLDRAHGMYRITGQKKGKQVGEAVTKSEPVTEALWLAHVNGEKGIGIVPINDDSKCKFGAIDIDKYDGLDMTGIIKDFRKKGFPLVPCMSKSGGLHLFLFSKDFVDASVIRAALQDISASLGFNGCEVFPKQNKILVERGDIGSWINMPYFDYKRTTRFAMDDDGKPLSIVAFIELAESLLCDPSKIKAKKSKAVNTIEFPEGPPCLQNMASSGVTEGMRNEVLYNMAIYFKRADPDNWMKLVEEANQKYFRPALPSSEVGVLIRNFESRDKERFYRCSSPPLKNFCNRGECQLREFGAGAGGEFPLLTGLTKYDTIPPTWFLEVDGGGRMELTTEDLQSQERFQRRCMDCWHLMPPRIKMENWRSIVQALLTKVIVIDVPKTTTPAGQLLEHLEDFCLQRSQAKTRDEIILGKPWTNEGKHHFRMRDFMNTLLKNKVYDFKQNKIVQVLKEHGAQSLFVKIRGKGVNLWTISEFEKQFDASFDPPEMKDRSPM